MPTSRTTFPLLNMLYMLEERINILKGLKNRNLEEFYREIMNSPPLYNIFVFDVKLVKYEDAPHIDKGTGEFKFQNMPEEGLKKNEKRIIALYKAILVEMMANGIYAFDDRITTIGDKTSNNEIKRLTQEYIKGAKE